VAGIKSRSFDRILGELLATFDAHEENGSWLGGVHFVRLRCPPAG